MNARSIQAVVISSAASCLFAGMSALAIDVGDPLYSRDVGAGVRVELLYEKFDRDTELKSDDITVIGPGGTATAAGNDQSTSVDENLFMVRFNLPASDRATVYLDAGVVDDQDAESTPFILGGGARLIAYERDKVRLSVIAAAHYVPSFDIEGDDFDADLGAINGGGEVEYYEAGAGMLLSGNLILNEDTRFVPYGGVMFSVLRGTVDAELDYMDSDITAKASADIEEDNPISAVAGVSLLFQKTFSLRVEGRIIGDSSVSAALGAQF